MYFNTMSRSKQMDRFSLQGGENQGREVAAGRGLASNSLVHIFPEALQSFVGQYLETSVAVVLHLIFVARAATDKHTD